MSRNMEWFQNFMMTKVEWILVVEVDKFTDKKKGVMIKTFDTISYVRVTFENGKFYYQFGNHSYPGAIGKVRIDNNDAVEFRNAPFESPIILSQMLGGKGELRNMLSGRILRHEPLILPLMTSKRPLQYLHGLLNSNNIYIRQGCNGLTGHL